MDPPKPSLLDTNHVLCERLRVAVFIILAALPLYVVADFYLQPPHPGALHVLKALGVAVTLVVWWATRQPGCVAYPLFGATLVPWGVGAQMAAVAITAVSVCWNVYTVSGDLRPAVSYPGVVVVVTWAASIYIASVLAENRRALEAENAERARAEKALREEAATSSALAHVGGELIAAIRTPDILRRLAQLCSAATAA
jgi:hypothetical protein